MDKKNILITGGAGFIGSNLAISFKEKYPSLRIIALDNLKRRGSELNIDRLKANGIDFLHGDIRNPEDLEFDSNIDFLIECSAEPSVLSGYNESPAYLINTNLAGTINCLELSRRHNADIIFLSTSRVYPYDVINSLNTIETETRFEWSDNQEKIITGWSKTGIDVDFTLNGPKSMYGATKLCSEFLLQEYIAMYGIKGIINRCGVVAGPWQFGKVDQGVFTLWVLSHHFKRDLTYIGFGGNGKQVRDLLHIDDLFNLVDMQISSLNRLSGNVYNVGGGSESSLSLFETTQLCEKITGKQINISKEEDTRKADVNIYITDNERVCSDFNWRPMKGPVQTLEDIQQWIIKNEDILLKSIMT